MQTSVEKLQALTQDPRVVSFFTGLFERIGVRVAGTGEQFTCHHRGDRIEFEPTLDSGKVDYVVDVETAQLDRLAEHAQRGELDEAEQYRVVRTLFTPATAATLKNPVLANPVLRRLAGAEDLVHVHLVSPTPEETDASHTLIYVNRQWLVFPGLHGQPRRIFRLSLADALTYHREVFTAIKVNKWSHWMKFSTWYRKWRKGVSTRP